MKLTKTKKIIAAVVSFALVSGIAIGSTMAYLTDKKDVTNTFTIGHVKIELDEPSFDETVPLGIEPGVVVDKDPTVTNTGTNPAYIRLKVNIPQADIGDPATTQDLFQIGYNNNGTFTPGVNPATTTIGGTEVHWEEDGDYYYLRTAAGADFALPKDAVTPALFTKIQLSSELREGQLTNKEDQDYAESNVDVIAQAVQTGSFTDADAAWTAFDLQETPAS